MHTLTHRALRILRTLSWCYQIRETCCPSPHRNANEKECADKRPDPGDERAGGGQQMLRVGGVGGGRGASWGDERVAEESVLVVVGDHSHAPPSVAFDTGLLSPFQRCIVGWCNPRRITKSFPFHIGGADPELSRGGNLFSRGGDPQFLLPSQGLLAGRPVRLRSAWGQS